MIFLSILLALGLLIWSDTYLMKEQKSLFSVENSTLLMKKISSSGFWTHKVIKQTSYKKNVKKVFLAQCTVLLSLAWIIYALSLHWEVSVSAILCSMAVYILFSLIVIFFSQLILTRIE